MPASGERIPISAVRFLSFLELARMSYKCVAGLHHRFCGCPSTGARSAGVLRRGDRYDNVAHFVGAVAGFAHASIASDGIVVVLFREERPEKVLSFHPGRNPRVGLVLPSLDD